MKRYLMVLSGGMDSVTMLHDYRDCIAAAVTFQYGSNHNRREARCARLNCEKLGIEWIEVDLSFMSTLFESSLLQGAEAIQDGHYCEDNMRSTVVPFRNGIMLAVAAGLAESRNFDGVMLANHSGDHAIYPDCRPEFVKSMGAAIHDGTYDHLELVAPYTHMTKGQIAMRGKELGVDYSLTYSFYKGGEHHCGKCGTCIERAEALAYAGITL
ncbi:MAG: 7-cyano-7-deazaguanine synthase QueC, partial [Duncaniella sp.]|nr:7-cyano-7-deazaguanine synthase QueC [Duncaniella sp.]